MAFEGQTKGEKLRRLLSFVCFDEASLQNGFLQQLVQAFELWMKDREAHDIYRLERSIRGREPDCNKLEQCAFWKKSRARYAWCVLLHAATGWFKSYQQESATWPLYLNALRGVLEARHPALGKDLADYATLVGGYADEETEGFLLVWQRLCEMTDEQFMSDTVTKETLLNVGPSSNDDDGPEEDGDDSSDGNYPAEETSSSNMEEEESSAT
jgi:hypothetical protein